MRTLDRGNWKYLKLSRKFVKIEYSYRQNAPCKKFKSFRLKRIRSFQSKQYKKMNDKYQGENIYFQKYSELMKTINVTGDNYFGNNSEAEIIERENNWLRLEIIGQPLIHYYSWAIPNERAIRTIASFAPILEIGAGKGYWSYLLRKRGVPVRCFDQYPNKAHSWTLVEKGTPETIFSREDIASKKFNTLLLCYPDENSELSSMCLDYFEGDYIIHVGELITTGSLARYPQSPFGRTTSSSFQIDLLSHFHCVACIPLSNYPFCCDYLTIWKRTEWVLGRNHYFNQSQQQILDENDQDDSDENEKSEDGSNEEEKGSELDYWANIPTKERYPFEWISPNFSHLVSK